MAKKGRRARPGDVIEGREKPGPRALVSLIAEVNPTGRGLSPSEQARRYAEKSALQSRLLQWYGDAFFAERTEADDIVLLRHRHFDECACHAQVSSLGDAARAWVWQNLDDAPESERRSVEEEGPAPAASDEAPRNPAALLAKAQAALAEYDYEEAERLLVSAFEATAGSAPASRALLELYVDVLGQDGRALELEARLAPSALSDPPVRSLIGLAAARSGDAARAVALVQDVAHPRAGEVYAVAGRAALRAGELEQARAHAQRARSLGAPSDAAPLEAAIDEALRERAAVEEAKLEARIAAGDGEGAEAFAREMLAAGFPSARAQRLLREAAERRDEAAAAELTKQAREAIEAGEWARGRRALAELVRMGRPDAALEAALQDAERIAEAAREAEVVAEVLDLLSRAPEEGLARYLALDDALRARVRAEGPKARCERADAIRGALKRPRPEDVASAALRVEALERALEANDLDQAVEHVESLPRAIEHHADVGPLIDRTLQMLARRHVEDARARIDAAVTALNAQRWTDALEQLRAIPSQHLSFFKDGPALARKLTEAAEWGLDLEARAARAREPDADLEALHRGRAALTSLRALASKAHEADGAGEVPEPVRERLRAWEEQHDALVEAMKAALRFEEHPVPEGTRPDIEDEGALGPHAPDVRIDADANIWLIASPEERCYLTEASLPDLIVKRRFSFTVGGERRARTVIPIRGSLWLPLSDGGMLVLDRDTPSRVLEVWWGGLTAGSADDAWAELAPDASAMVLRTYKKTRLGHVLRAYPSGATRPLPRCATACFFGRPGRARVLVTGGKTRAWEVYDPATLRPLGGAERFTGELAGLLPIAAIDVSRTDGGSEAGDDAGERGHVLLALETKSMEGSRDEEPTAGAFYLVRVSDELEPIRHTLVSAACTGLLAWLYRSGDSLLVVHYQGATPWVRMFDPWTLEPQGSLNLLPGIQFPVTDADSSVTLLLERNHRSLHIPKVPAGVVEDADDSDAIPFVSGMLSPRSLCVNMPDEWARPLFTDQLDGWTLKSVSNPFRRDTLIAASADAGRAIERMKGHVARTTPKTVLSMFWREPDESPDKGFFLDGAMYAACLCPDDPKLLEWILLAFERSEDPFVKAHLLHLMGLAHLAAGRRAEAVASWARGAALDDGHCPFRFLIAMVGGLTREEVERHLPGVAVPGFVWAQAERYERAVVAMGRLDAAIDAGRGEDAWREARHVRELVGPSWQLSARVALLHLDHPDPSTDPWRYQLDLAWMASHAWLGSTRNHMIFAGHHWDHHRLTAITLRAGQILDAMGIGVAKRITDATREAESTPPANEGSGGA